MFSFSSLLLLGQSQLLAYIYFLMIKNKYKTQKFHQFLHKRRFIIIIILHPNLLKKKKKQKKKKKKTTKKKQTTNKQQKTVLYICLWTFLYVL